MRGTAAVHFNEDSSFQKVKFRLEFEVSFPQGETWRIEIVSTSTKTWSNRYVKKKIEKLAAGVFDQLFIKAPTGIFQCLLKNEWAEFE